MLLTGNDTAICPACCQKRLQHSGYNLSEYTETGDLITHDPPLQRLRCFGCGSFFVMIDNRPVACDEKACIARWKQFHKGPEREQIAAQKATIAADNKTNDIGTTAKPKKQQAEQLALF